MLINAIYAQLVLIVATMFWFALSKRRSHFESLIKVASVVTLFLALWLGGVWVYPPVYGLAIIVLIFVGLTLLHARKPESQANSWRIVLSNLPLLAILPVSCLLLWQGFSGRLTPDEEFVELGLPFETKDRACVLSGGISPLLNFHIFPSNDPRDLGQKYALDVIAMGPNGFRTVDGYTLNPKPQNIEAYNMFDTPVFSPCSGTVVEQQNNQPDQPIGGSDKIETGGNGVVLQCTSYHIHLHHMKEGSVLVEFGDSVKKGQRLGRIGNSGNTIEPHLHLHAETIIEEGNSRKHGAPVHMKFDGRFMARGDCF